MSKRGKRTDQEPSHTESHNSVEHEIENHAVNFLHTEVHDARSGSGADDQKGYKFVVSNGLVTAVAEVKHGLTKTKSIKPDETFSINGTDILKTESKGSYQEISRYSDDNHDGIFLKVSEVTILNLGIGTTSDRISFVVEAEAKDTMSHWEELLDGYGEDIYTEVAHGSGQMVHLVGLATNLAAVDHLL